MQQQNNNSELPQRMKILAKKEVPPDFHAISSHKVFIDYLRIFGCIFVVMQHMSGYEAGKLAALSGWTYWRALATCGVPIFFFISGYMAMNNYLGANIRYIPFIQKRARRILLPYFCISLLIILSRVAIERSHLITLSAAKYPSLHFDQILSDLLFAGASMHLYFLPDVFLMYALFPFFKKVFESRRICFLGAATYIVVGKPLLVKLYALTGLHLPDPDIIIHFFWGCQFFLVGCLLFHLDKYSEYFRGKYGIGCFVFGLVLAFQIRKHFPGAPAQISILLTYAILSRGLEGFRPALISKLGDLTYGVYLFHLPYFAKAGDVLMRQFSPLSWPLLFSSVAFVLITTGAFVALLRQIPILRLLFLGETGTPGKTVPLTMYETAG